jgi:hypothetical protein
MLKHTPDQSGLSGRNGVSPWPFLGTALLLVLVFLYFGCAPETEPVPVDEPVAGSVAVSTQALTQTVTLSSVFTHFTANGSTNGITYSSLVASNGKVYYQPVLWNQLYWRVGDTATFPLTFGWYPAPLSNADDAVRKGLSGRKLYMMSNGTYVKGLNLEGKLVVP